MFYIIEQVYFGPIIIFSDTEPKHHIGPAFPTKERATEYAQMRNIEIGPRLRPRAFQ